MQFPRRSSPPLVLAAALAALGLLPGKSVLAAQSVLALPSAPTQAWVQTLFDSLKAPVPSHHLVGNIYYVGASGVSSFLITTPAGHILLDTGFADTVPLIRHSVEQLGFKLADIKLILSSHAHIDHTGGHSEMKRLTGAAVVASAGDARVLESGGADDFLPWPKDAILYAPVKADRIVADGEGVTLGGITLTAHLTPGHTRGATTWTMHVTDAGRTYQVVFFSSMTINPGVRLLHNAAYPEIAADYEATLTKLKALPCDIFFAPHGGQFAMTDKFARLDRGEGARALVDPEGWRRLLATVEQAFRAQLATEQSAAR